MTERTKFYILKVVALLAVLFAYQNSFDNAFHFDDTHTIVDNPYVRDISNIGIFYTDGARTFSSLPTNQVYRPLVTTVLAIDYWLSDKIFDNGYDTRIYHYTIMLAYIILLFLLYYFFKRIFDISNLHRWNKYFALLAATFFGVHTVNAETINYIISCSDLYSTLFVVASFVIFMYFPQKRKLGLFLIPFALGMLVKLTTAMFIPMLFVYYFIFEYLPKDKNVRKRMLKSMVINAAILLAVMLISTMWIMSMASDTFAPSSLSRLDYIITMPGVLLHYVISFFAPYNLSADTDWQVIHSIINIWFISGTVFLILAIIVFLKTYNILKYAPVAFGIAWFYIALAPTSSLIPLAEVLNDHRMFFPFVGLMAAVIYLISLLIIKYEQEILQNNKVKYGVYLVIALVLSAHVYGTRMRTEVWDSGDSLWYNVTIQSPNNGRGLMNYGLILMSKGNYTEAMEYYQKALILGPKYSYLHTNLAICYNALGDTKKAEYHFARAIEYGYSAHKTYYYGKYLMEHKRYNEAIVQLNKSLAVAPEYIYSMHELMKVYMELNDWDKLESISAKSLSIYSTDPYSIYSMEIAKGRMTILERVRKKCTDSPSLDNFIDLSLQFYNEEKYDSSAWAAQKALEYNDSNALAYNNICAANNMLGNYSKAKTAGEIAVKLNLENKLAINNLNLSIYRLAEQQKIQNINDFDGLLNLSLYFYNKEMYYSCILACNKAINYKGSHSLAFNNICCSYNDLKQYSKAVVAGKKAVAADSTNKLAKNNLAYALQMMNAD